MRRVYTKMHSKVDFLPRRLCSQFFSFARALCAHNGRSLQEKNWRSLLAKTPTFECISVYLVVLFLLCSSISYGAVYDCFLFFNEIELLKMRLEELDEVVDYFVLVESAETQRGTEKPFYFTENKQLFEKYLPKIIHIAVEERHPELGLWERENYQRNCIARGLIHCRTEDVILISDLDEIPRPSLVREVKNNPKHARNLSQYSMALEMSIYFYQLNRQTATKETC